MRTTFSRHDRLRIGDIAYQPVNQNDDHVLLMRLDGSGAEELFTYKRLGELRQGPGWRYERHYFALGEIGPALRPDGSRLAALRPDARNRKLFLHNACVVMEELRRAGELGLTYASVERSRSRIGQIVAAREIGRNLPGRRPRGGDLLPARQLPCAKTLLRHYRRFRLAHHAPDALVPRRGRSAGPIALPDPEAEALLRDCIWTFASPERPSKAIVVRQTEARFREENNRRLDAGLRPLKSFSRRTVERRIGRLDPFTVACHRYGADQARRQFASYGPGLPRLYPMERVEIDEWQVDLITFFGQLGITERLPQKVRDQLPRGRRWLYVAIDCASRCIVGLRLAERASAADAIALLRMIVVDKTDVAREIGARSPWAFGGGLGTIASDAGSAFQSDDFQTAVASLHGRMEFPPVRIPELRGSIERVFGTMAGSLMPILSGRTFASSTERGDYASDARAVLDDGDLLRVLLTWVIDVYHHRAHGGLHGQTPADRWAQLARERFVPEPPDAHERRTALGLPLRRALSKRGILLFANHYDCPALREKFRQSRDRAVDIRVDPDDLGAISVRIGNEWHPAPAAGGGLDGVSLAAWRESFTRLRQHHRDRAELAREIREEAIAAI